MFKVNEYETDVVVIGGGAAGLRAALEASKKNVNVLLVSKGRAGRSGCTVLCSAGLSAAFENMGDHPDAHFSDSLKSGEGLNDRELLRLLVYNAPQRVIELYQLGASLKAENGRPVPDGKAPGHSAPRNFRALPHTHIGIEMASCLLKAVKAAGVRSIDRVYVTDLIQCDNQVVGCIGLSLDKAELIVIKGKSTVLATGGGSAIYSETDNPKDMVGDGHSMAWRAGAEMMDMEFILFWPTVPLKPRVSPLMCHTFNFLLRDGATLRNRLGEDITIHSIPSFGAVSRDQASRYLFSEIKQGRGAGQGMYLDATSVDPALLEKKYPHLLKAFLAKGVDIRKEPFVVGPGTHSFDGGPRINKFCETTVPGLYAAGEMAGGIHGAHELSGNHLSDTLVFGAIAGEHADTRARSLGKTSRVERSTADYIKEMESMKGCTSYFPTKIISELKEMMWDQAGVHRTESGLKEAKERIDHYREILPSIKVERKIDFFKLLNLRSILDVAALVVTAAWERKESRGPHYREDFPQRDDGRFLGNIILRRQEDRAIGKEFRPLINAYSGKPHN